MAKLEVMEQKVVVEVVVEVEAVFFYKPQYLKTMDPFQLKVELVELMLRLLKTIFVLMEEQEAWGELHSQYGVDQCQGTTYRLLAAALAWAGHLV